MNAFQTVGQIVARDRKGRSFLVTLRYGAPKNLSQDTVQFVEFTRFRIPPRLMERIDENDIQPGVVVAVQGHLQGVLHRNEESDTSLINELVATRVTRADVEIEGDAAMANASSKGQDVYLHERMRQDGITPESATDKGAKAEGETKPTS